MKYLGKITDPKDLVTKEYTDEKYTKPSDGIPSTDLASSVRTSLNKADRAMQSPSGGTTGQVLTKTESGYAWQDITWYNGEVQ